MDIADLGHDQFRGLLHPEPLFRAARACSAIQPSSTRRTSICCVNVTANREGYR